MDGLTETECELAERVLDGHAVVVNVRRAGPHKRLVPWLLERGLVTYIGHRGNRHSWPESEFANPFVKDAKPDRNLMLRQYREYLAGRADLLGKLPELEGRALGCWCSPLPCHGDVLLEYLR